MKRAEGLITVMTPEEKRTPKLLILDPTSQARCRRIAKEAGVRLSDVSVSCYAVMGDAFLRLEFQEIGEVGARNRKGLKGPRESRGLLPEREGATERGRQTEGEGGVERETMRERGRQRERKRKRERQRQKEGGGGEGER